MSLNGNVIDSLQIVHIPDESLVREGNGLFSVKEGFAPEAVESPDLSQGSVETSNVDPIKEMIGLINTQRAYESFQKVMKSFTDTYSQSIRNVGAVA